MIPGISTKITRAPYHQKNRPPNWIDIPVLNIYI